MKISINGEPHELAEALTIQALLEQIEQDQLGIALAINESVIGREGWVKQLLCEGDDIVLFKAIAGG